MKKYYLPILQTIELILSIINMSFFLICDVDSELGLIFTKENKFIPLIISLLIIFFYILEFFKSKPYKRIVFFSIAIITCLLTNETINLLNSTICVFSIIYSIIMLIIICISSIKKDPQPITKIKVSGKKTLPIGYFSKKDYVTFIFLFLTTILTVSLVVIFYKNIILLITFLTLFIGDIFGFIFYAKKSKLRILLEKINKDLSFESFLKYINELENSKDILHFETYNFLKIIKANYYFTYDVDEGLKIFETCLEPTFTNYKNFYDVVLIEYYINKNDSLNAKKAFENNSNNKAIKNSNFPYVFIAIFSELEIPNIEIIFPLNNKLKINDCINLNTLMLYYYKRNNLNKAKEMAQKMLDMHSDFKHYNNLAKQILYEGDLKNEEVIK